MTKEFQRWAFLKRLMATPKAEKQRMITRNTAGSEKRASAGNIKLA